MKRYLGLASSPHPQGRRSAGTLIRRIGSDPRAPWISSRADLHAHVEGFDLHAAVSIAAADRDGRERLSRYLLRPAVAQDRLELLDNGNVQLKLRSEWSDGTTHLEFEPSELIGRLASLVPKPRTNLLIYHGVLAPHATWRARVIAHGLPLEPGSVHVDHSAAPEPATPGAPELGAPEPDQRGRNHSWPERMRRAFGFDVLACPTCGGRMRFLALILSPPAIRAILDHLGISCRQSKSAPRGRAPPDSDASSFIDAESDY